MSYLGLVWLILLCMVSGGCRSQRSQMAPVVTDPFLIQRPTTVPPPATGTVSPLGTIQPLDPSTATSSPQPNSVTPLGTTVPPSIPAVPPGSAPFGTPAR